MNRKTILTITALLAATSLICHGQIAGFRNGYRQVYTINWQSYLPLGTTNEFLSRYSLEGLDLSFAYFFTEHIGAGIDISWNCNGKAFDPQVYYPDPNTAVYAGIFKYTEIIPIKAQFKYMINPESFVKIYASAGIGALKYGYQTQIQEYSIGNNSWGFLANPEIGILIPFGKSAPWGLNIAAGYNWATNKFQNLYFNAGIFLAVF